MLSRTEGRQGSDVQALNGEPETHRAVAAFRRRSD